MAYSRYATEMKDGNNNIYGLMDEEAREQLSDLNSALTNTEGSMNPSGFSLVWKKGGNKGVVFIDGTLLDSSSFSYTDFIDVSAYDAIIYKRIKSTSGTLYSGMAFYSDNTEDSFVSGERGIINASDNYPVDSMINVPATARYARFTYRKDTATYGNFSVSGVGKIYAQVNPINDKLNYSAVPITWDENGNGKYLDASGDVVTNADMHYSDLLHIFPGNALLSFDFTGANMIRVHGYDRFGDWVSQIYYQNAQTGQKWILTIPANVEYVRLSMPKSATNICLFEEIINEFENVRNNLFYTKNEEISWANGSDGSAIAVNGSILTNDQTANSHYSNLLKVFTGKGRLTFTYSGTATNLRIHGYNEDGEWVKQVKVVEGISSNGYISFSIPSDIYYIRFSVSKLLTITSLSFAYDNNPLLFDEIETLETAKNKIRGLGQFTSVPVSWDENGDEKYIGANGTTVSDSSMHYSDLLPAYKGSASLRFDLSGISKHLRIHGYNEVGAWVKQVADLTELIGNGTTLDFTIPDDVYYLRISIGKNTSNICLFETLSNGIEENRSETLQSNSETPTWDADGDGKYINANGGIQTNAEMHYSELLGVHIGKGCLRLSFSGSKTVRVHGYNAKGIWIRQLAYQGITTDAEIPFTITEEIYYIRVSVPKSATNVKVDTASYAIQMIQQIEKRLPSSLDNYMNISPHQIKISSLGKIDDSINSGVEAGSYYSLCCCRNQLVSNSQQYPIGWLYQRSPVSGNECELWYSANQIDKPKRLTTISGFGSDAYQRSFAISPTHGDIITCQRDIRNRPYIYDASTGETVQLPGRLINPIGWLGLRGGDFGIDDQGREYFMFGEYTATEPSNQGYENLYVWKVTYPYTDPNNWSIVHSMERASAYVALESGKPWHIHTMMRDPYTDIWYLSTGDQDTAVIWKYSSDAGATWTPLLIGTEWDAQVARTTCFVFTENYIWWASDWGTNHSLNKLPRLQNGVADVSNRIKVCDLNPNQSTYATVYMDYPHGLFMIDNVDLPFRLNTDSVTLQFYSFDDDRLYDLITIKRLPEYEGDSFGFRCLAYTLQQSPYERRIGVGFNTTFVNKMKMTGNVNYGLCTVFFELN